MGPIYITLEEAKDLAILLRSGALPVKVSVLEVRTVGPSLGQDSKDKSVVAFAIGLSLVVFFMLAVYRISGFVADTALLVYVLILLGILYVLHATLTLPSIAGIILSIGMAVDANVLIFERFKEEIKRMAEMQLREHDRDSETKFIKSLGKEKTGENSKARIVYIDFLELIMKYIKRMANIITYVLIGFSSISLIVSTIMISIIVYTSVLERKKEIGILRSLGARKKDVSRLFSAESFMLGSISGLMGIAGSLTIWGILEAIIRFKFKLVQQGGLISIKWYHCVIMLATSIVLSILAGLLPSALAAKQDPAITLRTQ